MRVRLPGAANGPDKDSRKVSAGYPGAPGAGPDS